MPDEKYGRKWSVEETILAYYYYCRIPFGRIHKANPEIIRVAGLLGRTPSSVVFKMGNLAHFDPEMQKRNVSGLKNASKTDCEVVERFHNNWEDLTFQANRIENLMLQPALPVQMPVGNERIQEVKARVNQDFFRDAVLASYHSQCCITGVSVPTLLVASHIKPWAVSDPQTERTNPSNGLCLNALHDRAFDKGLLTVLPDYTVRISSKLKAQDDQEGIEWLISCDGKRIHMPERFIPHKEFLEYHNDVIFIP